MHHREKVMKQFGKVPEHYLVLLLRCLDPDMRKNRRIKVFLRETSLHSELTEKEKQFTKMWHFSFINEKMPDISYATNFFEVARVEALSASNSRRTRLIYKKICECLPKIGKVIRENTKPLQEEAQLRILSKYLSGIWVWINCFESHSHFLWISTVLATLVLWISLFFSLSRFSCFLYQTPALFLFSPSPSHTPALPVCLRQQQWRFIDSILVC